MKTQTLSIVAGSRVCNASCPFCISKMTGLPDKSKRPPVNWRNFHKACRKAQIDGVDTVLITGKGEPTIFPEQISQFLENLEEYKFPYIELQTNGKLILDGHCDYHLLNWYEKGLTTIAISVVHIEPEMNQTVYQFKDGHFDIAALAKKLQGDFATVCGETVAPWVGFSLRLCVMLLEDYIDSPAKLVEVIDYCRETGIQQLTIRPIRRPKETHDSFASRWVEEKGISDEKVAVIAAFLEREAQLVGTLPHGAKIYDFNGQNICLSDCLTFEPDSDKTRQLIFFPDGTHSYDWQFKGAVMLGGVDNTHKVYHALDV